MMLDGALVPPRLRMTDVALRLGEAGVDALRSDSRPESWGHGERPPKAAERQQRRRALLDLGGDPTRSCLRNFCSWGAPLQTWVRRRSHAPRGHPDYVALLKAAELPGATHQAVMAFQVITDKRLPKSAQAVRPFPSSTERTWRP